MELKKLILPGVAIGLFLAFRNIGKDIDISNQFTIAPGGINFKESKPGFFSTVIYPEIEITNPTNSSTTLDSISGSILANGSTIGSYYLANISIKPGINIIKLPTKISTISTLTTLVNYFTKGMGKAVTLGTQGILNKGAFNFKFSETYNIKQGKVNGL